MKPTKEEIKEIITYLIILDDVKIGFHKKANHWIIHNIWETYVRGENCVDVTVYGVEIRYSENGNYYTATTFFEKNRVDSVLRDRKLSKILPNENEITKNTNSKD